MKIKSESDGKFTAISCRLKSDKHRRRVWQGLVIWFNSTSALSPFLPLNWQLSPLLFKPYRFFPFLSFFPFYETETFPRRFFGRLMTSALILLFMMPNVIKAKTSKMPGSLLLALRWATSFTIYVRECTKLFPHYPKAHTIKPFFPHLCVNGNSKALICGCCWANT